jgi:ribosomal protein S3
MWLKSSKNICKYIKKKLDNVHFKKHRRYFLFFFKILNKFIKPIFKHLNIKGIKLTFRGKLGKGGNSRKRVMSYKAGEFSLSNKMLCINSNKWDVWTKTGTVGCSMHIFYNKYDNLFKSLLNNIHDNSYKFTIYN